MAARAPRHLARPPKRFGLSPLQRVFLLALFGLAALTAVIGLLLARDPGADRTATPATARAPATTGAAATTAGAATTSGATATSAPATRPIRPTPGNLLADGDFERDLSGWAALGGAKLERVEGGSSGRWAAALAPAAGAGSPGMVRAQAATTRAERTYEAVVWVRGRAGGQVQLALRELAGGRVVSSDEAGYTLPGPGWQQLAVEHHTRAPGSSLAMEVVGLDLPAGERLLVDAVDLQVEQD